MRLKKLVSCAALSIALATPLFANATSLSNGPWFPEPEEQLEFLSLKDCLNEGLEVGSYAFGSIHKSKKGFFDSWSFSLAESSNLTINLFDIAYPDIGESMANNLPFSKPLLDNSFLTASLFDEAGNLLGTIGENGLLTLNGLQAETWYTLAVSGKAVGQLGGAYYGSIELSEVPIGDTLPLLGSALVTLAIVRRQKKTRAQTETAA